MEHGEGRDDPWMAVADDGVIIREMRAADGPEVIAMMRDFYHSPALLSRAPEEVFERDVAACVGQNPFVEGIIVERDGVVAGYGMIARSWSTERGGPCIWVEDVHIRPEFRGRGLGTALLRRIARRFAGSALRLRLEAARGNGDALRLYRRLGYEENGYVDLIREL